MIQTVVTFDLFCTWAKKRIVLKKFETSIVFSICTLLVSRGEIDFVNYAIAKDLLLVTAHYAHKKFISASFPPKILGSVVSTNWVLDQFCTKVEALQLKKNHHKKVSRVWSRNNLLNCKIKTAKTENRDKIVSTTTKKSSQNIGRDQQKIMKFSIGMCRCQSRHWPRLT